MFALSSREPERLLLGAGSRADRHLRKTSKTVLWSVARSERRASLAELYLARYPNGAHVDDAKALIASLRAAEQESSSPELACERLATHPHDATASVNGVEMDVSQKERGGRRPILRSGGGGASGNRALPGSARPRDLRRRPLRRSHRALSQGRGRQRRPGHGQSRSPARDGRPRAEGPQGGLCAL